jgi:hypothetical protein
MAGIPAYSNLKLRDVETMLRVNPDRVITMLSLGIYDVAWRAIDRFSDFPNGRRIGATKHLVDPPIGIGAVSHQVRGSVSMA